MNNNRNELEFMDILNIMSFIIGMMNYGENMTQGDKQDIMHSLDNQTQTLLENIHNHLTEQDRKLEEIQNDIRRYICKDNTTSD